MQTVKKIYRKDYTGEEVVKTLTWANGVWTKETEFAPNNVVNNQISNKAVAIGNGPSRLNLYPYGNILEMLKKHKGGLLASGAVQTYGCNALYRDFTPDFLVCSNDMATELAHSGYCDHHIVYGSSDAVLEYPGKFYLTPQNPSWDAGAIAAYMACFDGHKQVYVIGHDCHSDDAFINYNVYTGTPNYPAFNSANTEGFFIKTLTTLMQVYNDVEFVRVMPDENWYCPDEWKYMLNFRQIHFNDFVTEIDL
jgi:hypothetical protein